MIVFNPPQKAKKTDMKSKPEQSKRASKSQVSQVSGNSGASSRTLLHTKRPESESDFVRLEFSEEAWEQCCRAMWLALKRPAASPMEAHAALDRFLLEAQIKEALTLDSPVSLLQYYGEISLTVREINELERAGYQTLRSMLGATDQDFLMIRNFGEITLSRLRVCRSKLREELKTGKPVSRLDAILKGGV